MTPEERQLITGLFDRMSGFGSPVKDRVAEAVINERMRSTPDAAYMLVQSVLVQDHALQEAEGRIRDLEDRVRDLQNAAPSSHAPASSGSFLGGLLGAGRPASQPSVTSVPPLGSRAAPSAYDDPPPYRGAQPPPPAAPPAGGGFLRSAMSTAAGVAGGVLAAGAIRDLLGGGNTASANTTAATAPPAQKDATASAGDNASQQASSADPGKGEAGHDQQVQDDADYDDTYDDPDSGWDDADLDV